MRRGEYDQSLNNDVMVKIYCFVESIYSNKKIEKKNNNKPFEKEEAEFVQNQTSQDGL